MADPFSNQPDPDSQGRASLVRIVRMGFLVVIATITLLYAVEKTTSISKGETQWETIYGWWMPVAAAIVCGTLVFAIDLVLPRKKISTISALAFGLVVGLTATGFISSVIDLFVRSYELKGAGVDRGIQGVKVLVGICMCYLCISVILQTQDDFRLVIPYVEFAKQIRGTKPLLLDTSALIDARIADLASTGVLQSPLVIPRFVVGELQMLADSAEKLKRARGKRGLEIVARLQRTGIDVSIDESTVPGKAVDQMLVELARVMPGIVVTSDAALARVATIQGVPVINMNDVANALKPSLVPGSALSISLLRAGEQPGQAVGFLDDGTMVVVDRAAEMIGSTTRVEVTTSLQTSAGRLIFARMTETPIMGDAAPGTPTLPAPQASAAEADPAGEPLDESGEMEQPEGAPTEGGALGAPLRVAPPESPDPEKPGPFPPRRGQRGNPSRNPRR